MTTPIAQVIDELAEDFELLEEWEDRYRHVIDLGRKLPAWPEADRREDELVAGCQSRVWLRARAADDRLHFQAASDSAIVQGLLALILSVYQDRAPVEILNQAPDFLARLGLAEHLSPSRRNGTQAVIGRIRAIAAAAS
ncbi:MAG: SufE family protein [Alphaproteobacteria bacterium]|jgi:cysteine desulfuration protein SufE|nr:SufE family protein [Alphaproteobacteria bacterium]